MWGDVGDAKDTLELKNLGANAPRQAVNLHRKLGSNRATRPLGSATFWALDQS